MLPIRDLADLGFERREIERISSVGTKFKVWTPIGMPKLPIGLEDSTFFLFLNRSDALSGANPRGTGFLAAHEANINWAGYLFAVTNWHVAVRGGASVIRLNTDDGGIEVYEFDPAEWFFDPHGSDVAILPLEIDRARHSHIRPVDTFMFASQRSRSSLGVGEDTFMIGMFVDHQAKGKNMPAVRFGNISMLPNKDALIKQPNQHLGECFVVDMHSRTGFPGSPVFAYRTFGSDLSTDKLDFGELDVRLGPSHSARSNAPPRVVGGTVRFRNMFVLLGIQFGQFPEYWPLKGEKNIVTNSTDSPDEPKGEYVEGMSGMTCVIPAWQILEILQMPALKKQRDQQAVRRPLDTSPKAEIVPRSGDANPNHREDFNRLLDVAARKKPRDD